MDDIEQLVDDRGGIVTVRDLAEALDVDERHVREWAHENDVPRAGNAFAFNLDDAQALAADLDTNDSEDQDEEGDQEAEEDGSDDDSNDSEEDDLDDDDEEAEDE